MIKCFAIHLRRSPTRRCVARRAIRPEHSNVRLRFGVTRLTLSRHALRIHIGFVALGAGHGFVFAVQRKLHLSVIEAAHLIHAVVAG